MPKMKIKSLKELEELRKKGEALLCPAKTKISVGLASCGKAAGAEKIFSALRSAIQEKNLDVILEPTGCIGYCQQEPIISVQDKQAKLRFYPKMDEAKAKKIIESLAQQQILKDDSIEDLDELPFYKKQLKIALRNCGFINPRNIEEYIARDGYQALLKVLKKISPEQVIETTIRSGLRGRGGAGFPTGKKWHLCRQAKGDEKYIICNADEGDPGAFMDRSILEGDPHTVIEGMIIGAYAIGAKQGFVYVRTEYPLAVASLKRAIAQAHELGLLGENIMDSGFSFDLKIRQGAGAFVCGEETALIASIEGKVGEPRPRPPYPAVKGLFGQPTNINNVKTWSHIPVIILKGAEWYSSLGTEKNNGTTVFSLVGKIKNTGLVEIPLGTSLREMIFEIGGGPPNNKKFKAVQTGGPSGGCIPESLIDLPIEYEKLSEAGSMMGSGGMIVLDEDTCMVNLAKFFLGFTADESCGKCTPCREGTKRMLEILTDMTAGKSQEGEIELLEELAGFVKDASLCGLGQTAPNPVLTTLKYFRSEYEAHIKEKKCPAHECTALIKYTILAEKCTGCMACLKPCPTQAISGKKKEAHTLDQSKCIKCRACYDVCKFAAVLIE